MTLSRYLVTLAPLAAMALAGCQSSSAQRPGAMHGGQGSHHGSMHSQHQGEGAGQGGMDHQGGMHGAGQGDMDTHHKGAHKKMDMTASGSASQDSAPLSFDSPPPVGTKARCPVMGSVFTVEEATPRSVHGGKHYVFCCPGCKPKFDASPQSFLDK